MKSTTTTFKTQTGPSLSERWQMFHSLYDTFENDPAWQSDVVSKKSHLWCKEVKQVRLEEAVLSTGVLHPDAQQKIDELVYEILVNVVDGAPLEKAVRIREWTLEEWQVKELELTCGVFPADGGGLEVELHLFARGLGALARPLATPRALGVCLVPLTEAELKNVETLQVRGFALVTSIFTRQRIEDDKETAKALKNLANKQDLQREALLKKQEEDLRLLEERQKGAQANYERLLSNRNATHALEKGALSTRLNITEQRVDELGKSLTAEKERVQALAREAEQLRAEVAAERRRVQELANRPAPRSGGGRCVIS